MLKLIRLLRLPDRLHHSVVSADGRRFVAGTRSGACVLFDDDLRERGWLDAGEKVGSIQLNDNGRLLLVGFDDRIEGYDVRAGVSRSLTLPVRGTSFSPCVFSRDDPVVCVASWHGKAVLAAYDLGSGECIAEHPLPRRGGEGYDLVAHPEGEAMAAIAYSGQSEEWMFWAHYRGGRLRVFERPEIRDVSFPNFGPAGAEFVSHHERLGLCRMRFPSGELIGSVRPEDVFVDERPAMFGYDMHYLDRDRALVWEEGRALHEFDLGTLRPTRRVLEGAGGREFGEQGFFSGRSWQMARRRLLTSDDQFDAGFRNAISTLRLWDASALYGPRVSCDPGRPFTEQLLGMG